ncbi:Pre-mRNA-splicing factor 38, partial [Lineolata rhizophorae]
SHTADARRHLDNRGYVGPLTRGVNPATLFEKPVVDRIIESYYWKEQCFGLNEASLCDRAVELTSVGGVYGGGSLGKASPFLCLAFKLLTLAPDRAVVEAYLNWGAEDGDYEDEDEEAAMDEDGGAGPREKNARRGRGADREPDPHEPPRRAGAFKYVRALAAFYVRVAWDAVDVYRTLEPLLGDWRKLRRRTRAGFVLTTVDQFVDDLLTKERVCATTLWKLPQRSLLEDLDLLEPRVSPLGEELEALDADLEGGEG